MKKLFLCLMLLSASATSVIARNLLVATLNHNDTISVFYGGMALIEAHKAAVDGDVINLSSGSFNSTHITKAITLRGMGMERDTVKNILPTVIAGDFSICIPHTVTEKLTIEGICHKQTICIENTGSQNCPLKNATFSKCRFNNFTTSYWPMLIDVVFMHCKIETGMNLRSMNTKNPSNITFLNSYVRNFDTACSSVCSATFLNCMICQETGYISDIGTSYLINSIVKSNGSNDDRGGVFGIVTNAENCIAVNCGINPWKNVANQSNRIADYSNLFKTYTGTYSDTETFELTDSAKAVFLGDDGTQVGIHGGVVPFEAVPDHPRITKFEVGNKSTSDGKLNVNITVEATGKSSGQ